MKKLFLPLILLTSLISCQDNLKFNDIRVNVNTSMPAGALKYSDQSLLALSNLGDILVVNDDKILSVVYKQDMDLISTTDVNRFFKFPEQNIAFNYETPLSQAFEVDFDVNFSIPLELTGFQNGESINEIVFGSGYLSFYIDNISVADLLGLNWSIPQLTDNQGKVIGGVYGKTVDLKGLSLKPNSANTIEIVLTGKLPLVSAVRGNLRLVCDSFTNFKGWLGRKDIAIDPIDAKFGNDFEEFNKYVGDAYFAAPKFSFKIDNTAGLSILLNIDKINIGTKTINLKKGLGTSKFLIQGESKTTIVIDNSMTVGGDELSNAINTDAKDLYVTLSAVANPNMQDDGVSSPQTINTINSNSSISGNYNVELPMDGWFKDIIFEEKISSVDLKTDNLTYENIVMAFTGANTMPLDMELTGYAGSVSDQNQLFDKPAIIPAAISDTQPYKIEQNNMIVVNINKVSIDKLLNNSNLMFRFKASTRGADKKERVKFYSPTSINLNVFMGVKAEIY